jgi:hypothetical protein
MTQNHRNGKQIILLNLRRLKLMVMKTFSIFASMVILLCLFSCKETATTQEEQAEATSPTPAPANPANQGNIPSGGHDQTFLTDKLFIYKASNVIGKEAGVNVYEGQWIDLSPDGSFKAGKLKEQTHTGKWDYNPQAKVLLLRPDNPTAEYKISEWNVMHNNDMVVLVGTQTYGNNSTQIQLVRSEQLP